MKTQPRSRVPRQPAPYLFPPRPDQPEERFGDVGWLSRRLSRRYERRAQELIDPLIDHEARGADERAPEPPPIPDPAPQEPGVDRRGG